MLKSSYRVPNPSKVGHFPTLSLLRRGPRAPSDFFTGEVNKKCCYKGTGI
jgi:hypothetical protein